MYLIEKSFNFSASHRLTGLPEEHICSRLHGHNYEVILSLLSHELDDIGFVTDYRELDWFKKHLDRIYDHRHLNRILGFNPTAENLAKHFFDLVKDHFPQLVRVTVKETEKTAASYERTI